MKLSELITTLVAVLAVTGDIPVLSGDMAEGANVEFTHAYDVVLPGTYPKGFLHVGVW